jgi:DNA-binding NarL/FixJ family response regulator
MTNYQLSSRVPQVVETETPQPWDALGKSVQYDKYMPRVYIADGKPEERSALRLLLQDMGMEIVGEAVDWMTTLASVPTTRLDMLLIDWDLLPRTIPNTGLAMLRKSCPSVLVVVLISHLDAREQAALLSGADAFISKTETPEQVAERLRTVAKRIHRA